MTDDKTISVYDSQVDSYLDMVKLQPADKLLLNFISRLNANDFVLDLGCGPANASATMREHGLRVDPVDASAEMIKLANRTYDIGARQATFSDIDTLNTYNGIWANFSLLHATKEDFPGILASMHRSLKTNGVFHLAMKTGHGAKRDKLDRFYSYYSEDQLRIHLQTAGFTVDTVEHGEGPGLAGGVEPWVAITSVI